jgi:palmitoyltransferase
MASFNTLMMLHGVVMFQVSCQLTVRMMRTILPKHAGDRIAFIFFIVTTHIVVLSELFVILPYIDHDAPVMYWVHVVFGVYIYLNIYFCLYQLCIIDTTVQRPGLNLPTVLRQNWFYCTPCNVNAPPRSYHCYLCDTCVLRRDHHCMFSGKCVGHFNQRYFITLAVYLTFGSLYCNYLNMDYAIELLGGLSFRAVFTMTLPLLSWLIGVAGAETFAVSFVSSMCLLAFIMFTMLLVYHVRNILRAQTCHESTTGIRDYDCGWRSNLESVLGERWYIALISPIIASPLCENGLEFRRKYQYENIKDM